MTLMYSAYIVMGHEIKMPSQHVHYLQFVLGAKKKMVPVTAKKREEEEEEEEEKKELTDKARARSIGPLERQVVSADANPRAVGLPTAAGVHPATSRRAIFSTCCFAYFQIENKTTHIM